MAGRTVEIVVEPNGTSRHLVDPDSERYGTSIGPKLSTRRASHVESWADLSEEARARIQEQRRWVLDCLDPIDPNLFWADLSPVGGPVLGPFAEYKAAINAEIAWLKRHNLPLAEAKP